ncbi:MAG: hypothetical protein FD180_3293 [Planctomycetota bacterium]|nr:MAG: hypothetical protein FD180_3293 [Planctomycetota bacterium]
MTALQPPPPEEALSRRASLDLLRARLMSGLAPSQAHALRGLLNGVVLSGEVVRLSGTGKRDEAAALAAGEALRSSTTRFREAFENFLKHLVTSELDDASCEPGRAMRDAASLLAPFAQKRRITVEASACPPDFPAGLLPGALVTVLGFAGMEVLKDVADGGRILFEAKALPAGAQIVVSGGPSMISHAPGGPLPSALDDAVAAFGGSRTAIAGSGYAFDIPVTTR